ncbi:Transposase DDE domain protein [compost metagenome]
MHLRLVAASPDTVFPDAMVPTSGNVGDRACAVHLVVPSDTTYVMDRGYDDYKKMEAWSTDGIRFVMRLRDRAFTTVLEDEKGRRYRLVTSIWHLSAEDIAQIYKCRWWVELFFKWIKQHLSTVHVHSYKPQAIWNQLFLALITALLVQEVKASLSTRQTPWQLLKLMRVYLYLPWSSLEQEVHRPRRSLQRKTSRSRAKTQELTNHGGRVPTEQKVIRAQNMDENDNCALHLYPRRLLALET